MSRRLPVMVAVAAALLSAACSSDDEADGCDPFREELAAIEETFDDRDADGWDDVVELQEATRRREALRTAIAAGSC